MVDLKTMKSLIPLFGRVGIGENEARIYIAALQVGEGTVQEIAEHARLRRTSAYYSIEQLKNRGILIETKRGKRIYYIAEDPERVVSRLRKYAVDLEHALPELLTMRGQVTTQPHIYFFYGPLGFKQLWDRVLSPDTREFRILTAAEHFEEYVKEKYIVKHIIRLKKKRNIFSHQIILDSPLAKEIVSKDLIENRTSKILPARYKLPFTELVTESSVAFISPRHENILLLIESSSLAKTRRAVFDALWDHLK